MPDTLEALFERVRTVEPPAPYAPAHEIRRRGRRQSYRHRLALGGAALAVGGLSAGTAIVAAGGGPGPTPPVLPTASPSVSPSPSVRPSRPPGGRLLQPDDLGGSGWQPLEGAEPMQNRDTWGNGDLCEYDSADYPSLPRQTDVEVIAWRSPGGTVTEVVETYEPGWGERNMADVRAVIDFCNAVVTPEGVGPTVYAVTGPAFAGDDSLLVRVESESPGGPTNVSFFAVIRVGDRIATIHTTKSELELAAIAQRAAARLG
jgi:hypothetical protein